MISFSAAKLCLLASRAPLALAMGTLADGGAASAGSATCRGSMNIGATVENNCTTDTTGTTGTTGTGITIVCRGALVKTELGVSVNTADVTITYTSDSGTNTATITYSP